MCSTSCRNACRTRRRATTCYGWASTGCRSASSRGYARDRKSTRLNSSHGYISYAVFCLKKKTTQVTGQLSRHPRIDGPEVEVVVADGLCGVAHRVVGVDHDRALAEIRFDIALERVAGVDQQDGPAIRRPRRAEVVEVPGQQGKTAESVSPEGLAVEIGRPHDRQRHRWLVTDGDEPERCGRGQREGGHRKDARSHTSAVCAWFPASHIRSQSLR